MDRSGDAFDDYVEQSRCRGGRKNSTTEAQKNAEESPFQVHSMTDIAGFGLIGHAREMALG